MRREGERSERREGRERAEEGREERDNCGERRGSKRE